MENIEIQRRKYGRAELLAPREINFFNITKSKVARVLGHKDKAGLILDAGGYDGKMSEGYKSVVLDLSRSALRSAAEKTNAVQGNFHTLPFRNNVFDKVLLSHVLEHSNIPDELMSEAIRVVKPGGLILIIVPNAAALYQVVKLVFKGEVSPAGNTPGELAHHISLFTKKNGTQYFSRFKEIVIENISGNYVQLPFSYKMRMYGLYSFLGVICPCLSNSLMFVLRKK